MGGLLAASVAGCAALDHGDEDEESPDPDEYDPEPIAAHPEELLPTEELWSGWEIVDDSIWDEPGAFSEFGPMLQASREFQEDDNPDLRMSPIVMSFSTIDAAQGAYSSLEPPTDPARLDLAEEAFGEEDEFTRVVCRDSNVVLDLSAQSGEPEPLELQTILTFAREVIDTWPE